MKEKYCGMSVNHNIYCNMLELSGKLVKYNLFSYTSPHPQIWARRSSGISFDSWISQKSIYSTKHLYVFSFMTLPIISFKKQSPGPASHFFSQFSSLQQC